MAPVASEGQSHVLKPGSQAAEPTLIAFMFFSVHCAHFEPWAMMSPSKWTPETVAKNEVMNFGEGKKKTKIYLKLKFVLNNF